MMDRMMIGIDLGGLCRSVTECKAYMRIANRALGKHDTAILLLRIGMMLTGVVIMNQAERIVKLEKKIKRLEEERTVG